MLRRGRPGNGAGVRPSGRAALRLSVGAAIATALTLYIQVGARAEDRALKLYNLHTQERATIVFKRNGVYDRGGLQALNEFMRDWRKDLPTKMDPQLFDLLWQAYRESGSRDYIQVVCGYRSPSTNGMLRRRSSAVAKNSLHMQGKAMDFFIPDVPLATLRAVGLRMQLGGVGFYPSSGSPFVHMDTGSVRHWPRMTRDQLVRVFPNGRTLHVPTDGQPLPGYEEALASYQARRANAVAATQVASFAAPAVSARTVGKPMPITRPVPDDEDDEDADIAADALRPAPAAPAAKPAPVAQVGVAVASYATSRPPMPRSLPKPALPGAVLTAAPEAVLSAPLPRLDLRARPQAAPPVLSTPDFDFGPPQDWTAPAVPAALASAMAERDQTRRAASLPIPPTAVVATIDVTRPLRAEAITTAVLRSSTEAPIANVPGILAYAPPEMAAEPARRPSVGAGSVPLPQINPLRSPTAAVRAPAALPRRMTAPGLTMTALDTQSLRLWIGSLSTRQKTYAVLTMPDLGNGKGLMEKPDIAFAAGFGQIAYFGLRTDRFSGPAVVQPAVVDLRPAAFALR